MTIVHLDIELDDAEREYIAGAVSERQQALEQFAREALLEWAAR